MNREIFLLVDNMVAQFVKVQGFFSDSTPTAGRNLVIILIILAGCSSLESPKPKLSAYAGPAVLYVKSLINPTSGLVASRQGECFTTVYKNSLAAMVFIHEDDLASAEGIFDVFNTYLTAQGSAFSGFPQDWNPCTGSSVGVNYWEGDNAFLLLALNYYTLKTGDSTKYATLSQMLIEWLLLRADHCDEIVAEGVANMYAALKPHVSNPSVRSRLSLLKSCFESTVDYPHVLDHTVRGALVFGNQKGFDFTLNFARTEVWDRNGRSIKAMSAFSGDSFINVEISAQLLLTGVVTNLEGQLPGLQSELEKMWIHGAAETGEGLPYFVTNIGFDQSATFPIIDPTCYMLFVYWRFNPWGDNK